MLKIYHNPRCSKSRETLEILRENGQEPEIVEYLKDAPDEQELRRIVKMLGIQAEELVRKGESIYKEKYKGKEYSNEEWIRILAENPVLLERPIVVKGNQAILGRPPQNVLTLL